MTNSTQTRTRSRAEREAEMRTARRAEQANIVAGLQSLLEKDEQLLGFARGRIAGGFRGKLNIGPEAFFAPFVNIGLTERRFVLQHIHPENGKPSEILPHSFPLAEIASITFADIETFGAEPACRLVVHLNNDLYCRLRLRGALNFESARSLAEVFTSLTAHRSNATTPTQRTCAKCEQILDQPYRFCPYCGQKQPETETEPPAAAAAPVTAEPAAETSTADKPAAEEDATIETASGIVEPISAPEPETPAAPARERPPAAPEPPKITNESPATSHQPPLSPPPEPTETPVVFAAPTPQPPPVTEVETPAEPPAVWPAQPLAEDETEPEASVESAQSAPEGAARKRARGKAETPAAPEEPSTAAPEKESDQS